MPELIEISGLDGLSQTKSEDSGSVWTIVLLILPVLLIKLYEKFSSKDSGLGDLGIIKRCREIDKVSWKPEWLQRFCLWDKRERRILGRHPNFKRALRQERLIQLKKKGIL